MSAQVKATYRFARIPEWILYHDDLDATDIRVYGVLDRADGAQCILKLATVAGHIGKSEDTVRRSIRRLEQVGAVRTRGRVDDDGRQTSNVYILAGDRPFGPGDTTTDDGEVAAPVQGAPGTDARDGGGTGAGEEGGTVATRTRARKNESKKNQNTSSSAAPLTERVREDLRNEFAAWWAQYPRRVGRALAKERYIAVRSAKGAPTAEQLVQALDESKRMWHFEQRPADKIPHASTWLHQRRFEDHLEDSAPAAPAPLRPAPPTHELCPDCGAQYAVGRLGEHLNTCPMGGPL